MHKIMMYSDMLWVATIRWSFIFLYHDVSFYRFQQNEIKRSGYRQSQKEHKKINKWTQTCYGLLRYDGRTTYYGCTYIQFFFSTCVVYSLHCRVFSIHLKRRLKRLTMTYGLMSNDGNKMRRALSQPQVDVPRRARISISSF